MLLSHVVSYLTLPSDEMATTGSTEKKREDNGCISPLFLVISRLALV